MSNDTTTTGTLTLFAVRADYMGCEYGSLFVVAASDADEAAALVQATMPKWHDEPATIESIEAIGTLIDAEPKVLESFCT